VVRARVLIGGSGYSAAVGARAPPPSSGYALPYVAEFRRSLNNNSGILSKVGYFLANSHAEPEESLPGGAWRVTRATNAAASPTSVFELDMNTNGAMSPSSSSGLGPRPSRG